MSNIEQKSQIKYLGVFIDEHLKWDAQLQHINNKITKNTGILYKLRYYVPMSCGGRVAEWFRALDLKSGGPWFKSSTLPLSGFVLGSPFSRTNYGLARFSVVASQIWETTPMKIKCLEFNSFKKEYELFLPESQAC